MFDEHIKPPEKIPETGALGRKEQERKLLLNMVNSAQHTQTKDTPKLKPLLERSQSSQSFIIFK